MTHYTNTFFRHTLPALLMGLTLMSLSGTSLAKERWVVDSMYLPMRSGKGNEYRIVANLKSGAKLTILSEDGEWLEARTRNGTTGYVRGQYLIDQPIAAQRLAALQTEHDQLKQSFEQMRSNLNSSQSQTGTLNQQLEDAQQQLAVLQGDYAELQRISEGAVTLNERHNELLHSYELLKTELDVTKAKNARLQSDSRMTFFLYGAGAVLLGVVITLVVPHLRRRRRFSEWAN